MTDQADDYLDRLMVGRSPAIQRLKQLVKRVAPSTLPVLLEGETGTGKELVAQALHALSGRPGQLVSVNVCSYTDAMFDDALFGHARGAFTGAHSEAPGLLDAARGGTLFLDEIGSMSLVLQVKLLRVLESRVWRRIGESSERAGTFGIVSATNQPLAQLVLQGRFRADLAFRLRGVAVAVPALRDRGSDIARLAVHFATRASCRLDVELGARWGALRALRAWTWPGNVRELRTVIEAAAMLSLDGVLRAEHVASCIQQSTAAPEVGAGERLALVAALDEAGGDPRRAAEIEGVSRATIFRRARAHGVRVAAFRRR